jgi:heat shock protein HtpX
MEGTVIAFFIASVMGMFTWFGGAGAVLSMAGAKQIEHADYPQLFNIVEEMKIASGIPMPKVYVITSPSPNAFATGRDPEHGVVAVTTGLMEQLNRDELQGVIAHEMGHIRNYDIRYALFATILIGAIALISDAFLRGIFRGRGEHPALLIVAVILAILAPISAYMLQMAISRQREFLADATAVELTRNPNGLASALMKISGSPHGIEEANRATQHLFIVNPVKEFRMTSSNLFSTHPPTEARLNALRHMGATI